MPIENTLIAKVGGGLIAAGGATTVGVVYRNDISNWFNPKEEKTHLYLVASKTGTKGSTTNDLYDQTTKKSNYECKFSEKTYACEIIKKITKSDITTKKWLNIDSNFNNQNADTDLEKSIFDTENNFYVLKIIDDNKPTLTWTGDEVFDVVQKGETNPKFGQLKPIFGKEGDKLLGKINLFLVKIKSFEITNSTTFTKTTGKTYKCGFINESEKPVASKLKECGIYKFADTQSSPTSSSNYDSLNFVGKEEAVQDNATLQQHEYYLVKFTADLSFADYSGKELIYFEEETTTPKKAINFSNVSSSFLFTTEGSTDDGKLLIIDKK